MSVSRDSGSSAWRYTSSGPYANGLRVNSTDGGANWNDSSPKAGSLYGFAVRGDVNVIPEPGTFAMLGLGLAAVGLKRRRR